MGVFFAWPIKQKHLTLPLKIVLYAVFTLCAFYLFTAKTYISAADIIVLNQTQPIAVFILKYGGLIAVGLYVLSFFRPAMGLYLLLLFALNKKANNVVSDIAISPTDWIIVFEAAVLLIIMTMLDHLFKTLSTCETTKNKFKISLCLKADKQYLQIYFLMAAIAVHFSNYFYSGIAKTGYFVDLIDGIDFWTWALENPTYILINNAWYSGNLPIAGFPKLAQHVFDYMKAVAIPANFIVISTQIICIFCLFKIVWTKIITVFYDLLHLMIFVTTGIFFWKWIILNTAIATALFSVRKVKIPKAVVLFLMLVVLLSPCVFSIVKLAWLDTRANNIGYLIAVDKAGREYRVPSNYFGALSITFAQQRIGRPYEGFFKTGTFGNSYDYDVFLESNNCQSVQLESNEKALTREDITRLSSFISRHHRYIIENLDEKGLFEYDAYPHHIWTNPWLYQDFYQLDKRDIIGYRYVIEAACVYEIPSDNKPFTADVKRREVYDIPFKQQQKI